jgi:acetyltransferase-like isoleucine patch superfamily enzyme
MLGHVYVHEKAIVESNYIGADTKVWGFTHIMKEVRVGRNCNIGEHCFIEDGVDIGNNVTIKNNNMLWRGVTVEDDVFIGPGVIFTNDKYPRSPRGQWGRARYENENWLEGTILKYGSSLGAGAVVLCGIIIGRFALIGSGAVVTKSVPDYALLVGNRAEIVGYVCKCGERLYEGCRI